MKTESTGQALSLPAGVLVVFISSDTALPTEIDKNRSSLASTAAATATRFEQIIAQPKIPTQPSEVSEQSRDDVELQCYEAVQFVITSALEQAQTEENLEHFQDEVADLIAHYGIPGIDAFNELLLQNTNSSVEPLAWRFLAALGVSQTYSVDSAARRVLFAQLNSASPGRRSAAASALGSFPGLETLTAMQRRARIETNRTVLATLKAHIRVLESNNGVAFAQAG